MAWTIDTNFGSTLISTPSFAPFPVGGGNKVIGIGSGIVYRDDIDVADVQIECDLVTVTGANGIGSNLNPTAYLIARRQLDGSFYAAAYTKARSSSAMSHGVLAQLIIFRYNGTSDVFYYLGRSDIIGSNPVVPTDGQMTKFIFRVNGDSLLARLTDSSDQTIFENGIVDDNIPSSGNPGIAGNLIIGIPRRASMFCDNLITSTT